jgi:hypothetical protein
MERKDLGRETWREYAWYCLLFGTVGSGVIGVAIHSRFFDYVCAVGLCIMGALLVGWVFYALSRALMGGD